LGEKKGRRGGGSKKGGSKEERKKKKKGKKGEETKEKNPVRYKDTKSKTGKVRKGCVKKKYVGV